MRRTAVVLGPACALALAACGGDTSPRTQPTTPPATTVSESPTPVASASFTYGAAFYSDTFKDKSKGWTAKDDASAKYVVHDDYATPLYTMTAKKGRLHLFPHPEFRGVTREQLRDYHVSALIQTTLSVGHEDLFGVTCRDLGGKRYSLSVGYDLRRTGSMPWRILKHDAEGSRVLNEGTAPASGGSAFRVEGTCANGSDGRAHLVLSVNETEVGRAEDSEPLVEGNAGLYLFSSTGKTTVNALDFSVSPATVT